MEKNLMYFAKDIIMLEVDKINPRHSEKKQTNITLSFHDKFLLKLKMKLDYLSQNSE